MKRSSMFSLRRQIVRQVVRQVVKFNRLSQEKSTLTQRRHKRTNHTNNTKIQTYSTCCHYNEQNTTILHQPNNKHHQHSTLRSYHATPTEHFSSNFLPESIWNNDEKGLLSYLENETKSTEKQIDKLLSNIDDKYQISRSAIEREIFDAASLIGDSEPETGPTGKYIYILEDDLNIGKRLYSRKLSDANSDNQETQKVFEINLQMEHLGPMSLSTDERYAVRMVMHIQSVETGIMKPQIIITDIETGNEYKMNNLSHHNFHNVEFGPKYTIGSTEYHSLFFTIADETGRPFAIYTCAFDGTSFSTMRVLYKDKDPSHLVDVQRTKGCQYVAISSSSKVDNEIHIVGGEFNERAMLRDPNRKVPWKKPKLVKKRQRGIQYYLDCGNEGDIIILAHRSAGDDNHSDDDESPLGNEVSVFEAHVDNLPLPSNDFGKPIHLHSKESTHFIEDMALFQDHLVLFERSSIDSTHQIRIVDRTSEATNNTSTISLQNLKGVEHKLLSPCGNIQYNSNSFKFDMESPLTPSINYDYEFESGTLTSSPFTADVDNVQSIRVHIESNDGTGTQIPLSMYYDKTVPTRGVVLIGYGSYGQSQNLAYDPGLVPLAKRGFVISYCHGRGGEDLGKQWYEAGRLYNKENAVNDYIACAKALSSGSIEIPNYQEHSKKDDAKSLFLASKSFSAGGIVVGASLNKLDEEEGSNKIFHAVSLLNPFLDVMGTMSKNNHNSSFSSSGHDYLTEHEYDEFGDPINDERARSLIRSYCPVLNIGKEGTSSDYPPMFIVSTLDDENVPFHHGLVYARNIREAMKSSHESSNTEDENVLLHIEQMGGHHLHGRRLDVCTLENCFLLGHLYGGSNNNGKQ